MNMSILRSRRALRVAGWAVGGVLAAGLVGGIADAATSGTTPATSSAPAAATSGTTPATSSAPAAANTARAAHGGGLLRHAVRGELTLRTRHGFLSVEFQLGVVTAVTGSQMTVRDAQGHSATYLLGAGTKVRRLGATAAVSAIQVGDRVLVIADGSPATALRIHDNGPPETGTSRQPGASPAAAA